MLRRCLLPAGVFAAVLLACEHSWAQTPADYYDENCAACHTIAQGNVNGGPDLAGVTGRRDREWLIRFLLDPEALASDPAVVQMIKDADGLEMPRTDGLTREMAEALLAVIEQRSMSDAAPAEPTAADPFAPGDVTRGRDLFLGLTPMSVSRPPCVHCHDAATLSAPGGGRVGPDLTNVSERLGGASGLAGWLRAMPTPMMRAVYGPASLASHESRALTAFFEDAAGHAEVRAPSRVVSLAAGSLALALILLGAIGLFGARRFRGVRGPLVAERPNRAVAPGGSR